MKSALIFLLCIAAVFAHGGKPNGNYTLTVGFLVEPAWAFERNGVDLSVTANHTGVSGANITVSVTSNGVTKLFLMTGVRGANGEYKAEFVPSRSGSYTFKFYGTAEIEGYEQLVLNGGPNATFTCAVDGFGCVLDPVSFPDRIPSNLELLANTTEALRIAREALAAAGTNMNHTPSLSFGIPLLLASLLYFMVRN
eukprot:TRINITY_DN960_c0_g1_i2.p1 TRINITY_DN960_c0_g1~~TRINITY_DN960_c0_g1_i2.p1  ORF type:complete len:196 (-),score=60.69 TRINITY_DN960_c0_g1_i2:59-646(-)